MISKSKINRAGQKVRDGSLTPEDELIIDEWRTSHGAVLNTFQAFLRGRTK
jgi:putative GTP pyrophosphokinase